MIERDWLEKLYLKSIKKNNYNLIDTKEKEGEILQKVKETIPSIIEILDKELKSKSKKILRKHRKDNLKFKKRLQKIWQLAYDQLHIFILFNLEYGILVSESYRKKHNDDVKFETLLRLHARACQIAFEVLELIKGGFSDGALARWRSLYEISIIMNFLENKPVELCQRYLDYYFVENYKETIEYQKNCTKLGYEKLKNTEIKKNKDLFDEQKKKYGDEFVKPYGWIGDYLPKEKWNFAGIEGTIKFKFMRSFYKMANNYIHSGSKGFLVKLGTYKQDEVMLAGPSNYGFADPAKNTAYSLFHTTMTLSKFETYLEDALYIKIGKNMLDRLSEEFVKIQKQIEIQEDCI